MHCGGLIGNQLLLLEMLESSVWDLVSSRSLGFTVFAAGCSGIVPCFFSSAVCAIFRLRWGSCLLGVALVSSPVWHSG